MSYNQYKNAFRERVAAVTPLLVFIGILLLGDTAFAQQNISIDNPTSHGTFTSLICGVFSFLNTIAQPLGMIFIVIAGITFVTARGNEQKVTEAKGAILWAVVGVFVLFLGDNIIEIVADIAGLNPGSNACP